MVTQTDYLGLNKPEVFAEEDRDKWGNQLNENSDMLDTMAIKTGLLGDMPNSGVEGRLFLSEDEEPVPVLYYDTGSEWLPVTKVDSNTYVVSSGDELQSALDTHERVIIAGSIDVTGLSPITVDQGRTIFGFGRYNYSASDPTINQSDIIVDDSANPTLHVTGNDVRIFGIAIDNANSDGAGIRTEGYSTNISYCDINAQVNAILCNGPDGSTDTPTEPRINFNRVTRSDDGDNSGSIGIHVSNQHDAKITNNIISGYDVGVQIDVNSAYVAGSHIYAYPADSMSSGIVSEANNHRIINNRIEDGISSSGVEIGSYEKTMVMGNIIQVTNDDVNGIFVQDIGGWLRSSLITGNSIQTYNDTGSGLGQAINMDNVDVFNHSDIQNNVIDGFDNYGTTVVNESAGADSAPTASRYYPGQIVENTDDNSIWVKDTTDTMVDISQSGGGTSEKTTLYMSDYSSGGVIDTEFETIVNDANVGDTIVLDRNDYELTEQKTINKSLTIDQTDDSTLSCTNTSNANAHILFEGGGLGSSTTTTEITTVGQRTVGVDDETIFSEGDRVLFMADTYGQTVDSQVQFAEIESTATGQITTMNAISREFASGCNIYVVDLLESPEIRNLNTDGGGNRHLQFRWCENPTFRDVKISEYLEVSLYALDCWKPKYINVQATDPEGTLSGEGEPIAIYRSTDGHIESPRVYDCRRGIDFAWGSRSYTIVDPVLHGCLIAGISVHQDNEAGKFHIEGGEIICQAVEEDTAHNGQGISMSSKSTTTIDGTRIVARANGIIASGETHATNVNIEPSDGTPDGNSGILIQSSDCSFIGCRVNDPDGQFNQGVWIDAADGAIENVEIDVDMDFGAANMVYVDGRGAGVKNVDIRGNYDLVGSSSNQGFLVHADNSNRVENIDISINMENHPEQGVRLLADNTNSAGVLDNIDIHDCYFDCGQAAVYDDGAGEFETLRVANCSMDTGSTSISFNDSPNKIFVTDNDVSGSISATGTNETISGNL